MKMASLRLGLMLFMIACSAPSLWANLLRCRELPASLTQRGRHDHHSIHATNLIRNLNLNSPKKWTETPWLESTQSHSAQSDLGRLFCERPGARSYNDAIYSGKGGVFRTVRSRPALVENRSMAPHLLEIHPAANRCPDWLKEPSGPKWAGVCPACKRGMVSILQWARRLVSQTV
jgi:hypothetical protein